MIASFFVIKPEELGDFYYNLRRNVLALVHYGFSREEVYLMPAGEVIDYVKIINDNYKKEQEMIAAANAQTEIDNSQDVRMAGNTVPGNFF